MVLFDFIECDENELLNTFCNYFQLESNSTKQFFESVNRETIGVKEVIEKWNINPREYDSTQVKILGKHMTTTE